MALIDFVHKPLFLTRIILIPDSSSEADAETSASSTTQQSAESGRDLLLKTQQELDQIYSTTESIMSTSSRLSKSLSRDSQHLFLASTEPVLRNSVLISIDSERLSSAESSLAAEKDDSRCSQQNPFSETSRYVQGILSLCEFHYCEFY